MPDLKRVQVLLGDETLAQLKAIETDQGVNRTEAIRIAVAAYGCGVFNPYVNSATVLPADPSPGPIASALIALPPLTDASYATHPVDRSTAVGLMQQGYLDDDAEYGFEATINGVAHPPVKPGHKRVRVGGITIKGASGAEWSHSDYRDVPVACDDESPADPPTAKRAAPRPATPYVGPRTSLRRETPVAIPDLPSVNRHLDPVAAERLKRQRGA